MKRLFSTMGLALLLLVGGLSGSASAQDVDAKVVAQVNDLLSGFEYTPKKADWDQIGPQAAQVLKKIAADATARETLRGRAISSLSYFPEADTQSFLTGLAVEDTQPVLLRRKALRSLAFGFGPGAVETIKPFLGHADQRLRESAVVSLGLVKTDEARELLKGRLSVEPTAYLKETIQKTLAEMGKE